MSFFIDYRILKYSIVNTSESSEADKDLIGPYSFIDFVKNLDIENIENEFLVDAYNEYLVEWAKIKKQPSSTFSEIRRLKYIELLKNIQLNFLNQDEQRILGNIDFNNPIELDVAIPFFVEKIKDIIEYYSKKRRDIKNSKQKWSTKGSKQFLDAVIAEYIIDNYTKNENTFQRYKQDFQSLSSFQKDYTLKYNGLYDLNDYRETEFDFDSSLFLSSNEDYTLSSLPITSFSDYSRDSSKLITELKKDLYRRYISTDGQYYNNGSVIDINSETPFYDPYNYSSPYISRISDTSNLLRDSDIGYYFTSKYIYTSNYYSPYGISTSNTEKLIGLLPKIDIYRSEDYKDYYFWSKYSNNNQALGNKPVSNKLLKRFYGYQSRDINLNDSVGGVENYMDNIQLWDGDKNSEWANDDVFEKFNDNILNRKLKNDFFFTLDENESVYKYVCDIFGNHYYLIKEINVNNEPTNEIYPLSSNGYNSSAISSISDFNVDDIQYYNLSSSRYNTEKVGVGAIDTKKSLYENKYSVGKLYVRTSNNEYVDSIEYFLNLNNSTNDDISNIINNIIDIDIIDDFVIFTTETLIITGKITYDYKTGVLLFNDLKINVIDFKNDPLNKTSSYWYDSKDKSVYFSSFESLSSMSIYNINIENNRRTVYTIDDSNIDYVYDNMIGFESISKPQLIKDDNFIYIISLITDTCQNNYYNIIKYEINYSNKLYAIYNKIYHPSNLLITSNLTSDSFALSNPELSSFGLSSNLSSFDDGNIIYWDDTIKEIKTFTLPHLTYYTESHYDNDVNGIIMERKPNVKYNLSDLISGVTPSTNTTFKENIYTYNADYIFNPSKITMDFRDISDFSNFIADSEPIYKIEFFVDGAIKTQFILDSSEINDTLYNSVFETSPINMKYVDFNVSVPTISIIFYSFNGKKHWFEFNFKPLNLSISQQFNKIELLDGRIKRNIDGNKDCIMYLNTRSPDLILNTTLINI